MFGNFIYFIVVLLIYGTYQPPEAPLVAPLEALALAAAMAVLFAVWARLAFRRLLRSTHRLEPETADLRYSALVTRLSILAVVFFAVNIYGLHLPALLDGMPWLEAVPTAAGALFLLLFVGYLVIVWLAGYDAHQQIYGADTTRRSHVLFNIGFAAPVILPWLLLSGTADLIGLLPFEGPKRLLATPAGELAYFLFFLFLVAVIGPVLIQRFWRCTPLEDGYYLRRIAALCHRAGLRYNRILYWPIFGGRMITAGVMGLVGRFRYILVTRSLLQYLTPEQIDHVIAHEIGHVKRHHLVFYLLFLTGYILLIYALLDLTVLAFLYAAPLHRLLQAGGGNPAAVGSTLFSLLLVALFLFYFRFVFGYFMRNFERQADLYVYRLFPSAGPLIATLAKIAVVSRVSPGKPNWHHFSIGQRIDYLNRCEADPRWIARHDRKVARSIAAYLVVLVAVGILGWQINFGDTGRRLNSHFLETAVQSELARDPHQPALVALLGDIHYHRGQLAEAAAAYEEAIAMDPDHAQALNNLAWLYATADRPGLQRPDRALSLALRAAAVDSAPHVLDTLAESYYVNQMYDQAAAAGQRALESAGDRERPYFEKQLKKFREREEKK